MPRIPASTWCRSPARRAPASTWSRRAAPTVKRVTQELGGKSANIILDDADFAKAIAGGTAHCFNNSGQSCNAPTRMLVPLAKMNEAAAIAKGVAEKAKLGDPKARRDHHRPGRQPHPVRQDPGPDPEGHRRGRDARRRRARPARRPQQGLLRAPDGVRRRDQRHDDRARGDLRPRAVDHPLQGRGRGGAHRQRHALRPRRLRLVQATSSARARWRGASAPATSTSTAPRTERAAPFGGYKQSGNGREWGRFGFEEFLEVKAVVGWGA